MREARRIDIPELIELTILSFALAVYVYVIGWALTWVRIAAAHLPVAATLPQINNQLVFAAGVRATLVMVIVFAAMCIVAYAVYGRHWNDHAAEWKEIVSTDRLTARERFRKDGASEGRPSLRSRWRRRWWQPSKGERRSLRVQHSRGGRGRKLGLPPKSGPCGLSRASTWGSWRPRSAWWEGAFCGRWSTTGSPVTGGRSWRHGRFAP
jgi:hypothetical protein